MIETDSAIIDPESTGKVATNRLLIVGIGSSHGDDQAGWKAIDRLAQLATKNIDLRRASVPHDLIDWLDEVSGLHIIDGYEANRGLRVPLRFDLRNDTATSATAPAVSVASHPRWRSAGSHQLDVMTVLELATSLDLLPPQVVLWAIPGTEFRPGHPMTAECSDAIDACIEQMLKEFYHA